MEYLKKEEKLMLLEGSLTLATLAEGLDCLRKANIYKKGLYYQAFLSLSIGIERLLKIIIIYEYRIENNGKFPENKYLKEIGHDLYKMFKIVLPKLLEDDMYNLVINFLNNFAQNTRYYNLDILTGKNVNLLNPLEEWKNIEDYIWKKYNNNTKTIKSDLDNSSIINYINEHSYILFFDMKGNQINNFKDVIDENKMNDIIQGYNVLVFYKIIKLLARILSDLERTNRKALILTIL